MKKNEATEAIEAAEVVETVEVAETAETAEAVDVVEVAAAAKVNLALLVGPRRSDGFHEVFSLMLPVTLADLVTVRLTPGAELSVNCDVCPGEGNLAAKAVHELEKRLERPLELSVTIVKRIPHAAGLGGGSSDAAATIVAVERLLGLHLPTRVKYEAAAAVGADVPFFLWPGAQIAMGRGNVLRAAPLPQPLHLVIVVPRLKLSTAQVYEWRDEQTQPTVAEFASRAARLVTAVAGLNEPADLAGLIANDLEEAVVTRHPEVAALRERMRELDARAVAMSGSGSAVFGLFADEDAAIAARARLAIGSDAPSVFYVTDLQPPRTLAAARAYDPERTAPQRASSQRTGAQRASAPSAAPESSATCKSAPQRVVAPPAAASRRPKRSGRPRPPKGAV